MRWLFVAHGSFWLIAAVGTGLSYAFSSRRRRLAKCLATPPSLTFAAAAFAGVSSLGVGLLYTDPDPSAFLICLAPMMLLGFVQRKRMSGREDLPPPLARMFALPMNPLTGLRHPVRHWRAQWAAFGHPLRSRREMREWHAEREKEEGPA